MPPPGFRIYLWSRVTLAFDLMTPEVGSFMALLRGRLVPNGIKTGLSVFIYHVHIFAKLSRLDVCKPTRLHHSFLLTSNNNKYLRTCKCPR